MGSKFSKSKKKPSKKSVSTYTIYGYVVDDLYANHLIQYAESKETESNLSATTDIGVVGKHISFLDTSYVQPMVPRNYVHPYPDMLAFKKVKVVIRNKRLANEFESFKFEAIVWLQIPLRDNALYESESGLYCGVNELQKLNKYCTKLANVIGVQFIGEIDVVKKLSLMYMCGQADLTSLFDRNFVYDTNTTVHESRAGHPGMNRCCRGIHFFLNIESAIQYHNVGYNPKYLRKDRQFQLITKRHTGRCENKTLVANYLQQIEQKQHNDDNDCKHISTTDTKVDIERYASNNDFPTEPTLSKYDSDVTYYQSNTVVRNKNLSMSLWAQAVHLFPNWEEQRYEV